MDWVAFGVQTGYDQYSWTYACCPCCDELAQNDAFCFEGKFCISELVGEFIGMYRTYTCLASPEIETHVRFFCFDEPIKFVRGATN